MLEKASGQARSADNFKLLDVGFMQIERYQD